jgi:hypothetical protein
MTAHLTVTTQMPAVSERVFDAIHDYDGRLAWDTLLQQAVVHGDRPGRGVVTTCTARRSLGGLAFTTQYKAFDRPRVAAVKLVRPTGPFATWGASIRHQELAPDQHGPLDLHLCDDVHRTPGLAGAGRGGRRRACLPLGDAAAAARPGQPPRVATQRSTQNTWGSGAAPPPRFYRTETSVT